MTIGPKGQIIPAPCIPVGGTESAYHRVIRDDEQGEVKLAYWMDSIATDAVGCIIDFWWIPDWT